jgi:hypothetical protein
LSNAACWNAPALQTDTAAHAAIPKRVAPPTQARKALGANPWFENDLI